MIYALVGVVVCVAVLAAIVAMRPPAFAVERSTIIAAPAEAAFEQVNDLHAWRAWSPFEKYDPDLKRTYDGPSAGAGASYGWSGNGRAGQGRMTIEQSDRPSLISIKLEFQRPFPATNFVTFSFQAAQGGTKVTWNMRGRNNFMVKAFSLFMNMEKMVGREFEEGLANLKTVAERESTGKS